MYSQYWLQEGYSMSCNVSLLRVWILISAVGFTVMALMVSVAYIINTVKKLFHIHD